MSDPEELARLVRSFAEACREHGLDLAQPLQIGWYNQAVDPAYRAPDFDRPSSLAVVVGNSRALWPALARALADDEALAADPNPVDAYCRRALQTAAVALGAHAWTARFSYDPPPRRVAMQRLAHVSGLAYLAPSQLSVHPRYGPWIALRALVVVDREGPPGPAPTLAPPCDCSGGCEPLLREALERSRVPQPSSDDIAVDWRTWLAVRDACPVGRAFRYDDDQIRYHYTKDRRFLPLADTEARRR
ncbi:hypothetical protein [Haliangium sp.]|uniref:hypothetical protein n=1 Tax=Haliangium sp. TaxID=2663208 RepID=UPI003D12631A